jgi:hypothetical protein
LAAFRPLLAGLGRFGYTETVEGSAGQAPGGKVASGDKVGRIYVHIDVLSVARSRQVCIYVVEALLIACYLPG